ncbi:hypothetical protein RUM43_002597 [Polyplax serrata]|uniref:TACO1/YebC-like second and third domain-containing protein n=1 Tax=Polyplax serrata TaxID=468196 RepID=A0AAN8PG86_POLSC
MRVSLPEHVKNHEKPSAEVIQFRGPGNSAFLIEMAPSKDVYEIRFILQNFILTKHRCRYEEPGISQFERKGFIVTKPITENFDRVLRKATVEVKEIEGEDVLPLKKTKQLKFLCAPGRIFVTALKLTLRGYEVDSSGVEYFPKYVVGLKKKDRALCERFLKVMKQLPNVLSINDNIQRVLM